MNISRLRLVAGPNGSGKSTFTEKILKKHVNLGNYVNPDEIAKTLEGNEPAKAAQQIGIQLREQFLLERKSMTYESVMSHHSHLEFLQRAKSVGYRTYFYFIGVEHPDINQKRVKERERFGGHGVPQEKIAPRYYRTMGQLFQACLLVNRAYIFDNSIDSFYLVAEVHEGKLIIHNENPAAQFTWMKTYLFDKFQTNSS